MTKSLMQRILTHCCVGILLFTSQVNAQTANINLTSQKQIIRGFGASNVILWRPDMTTSEVDVAFGTGIGQIGFSILRIIIEKDPSRWGLNLPTCLKAQSMGATIIAAPWHVPDNMIDTANGKRRLRYDMYDEYAAHLNDFVNYMKNNGVTLYGISVQNEPDIDNWTPWTIDEMFRFMRDFAHLIEGTRVMAPEATDFKRSYSDPILNNTTATANTDIICGHLYGGGLGEYPLAAQRGKEVWMTEYLSGENSIANDWSWCIPVAKQINDVMQVGWNAYVWWNIVRYYGPISDGENNSGEKGSVTKKGFVMSQFSRFIRPGYYRVEATGNPSSEVYLTAYKNGASAVIVVVNQSSSSKSLKLSLQNGSISNFTKYTTSSSKNVQNDGIVNVTNGSCNVTLDASSVTTFVSVEPESL